MDPFAAVSALAAEPGNAKPRDATLKYGTAGFRCNADLLASTALRMGAMAALVSRKVGVADAEPATGWCATLPTAIGAEGARDGSLRAMSGKIQ